MRMKKAPFNPEVLNHDEIQTIKMFVNLIKKNPYLKTTRGRRPQQDKEDLKEHEIRDRYLRLYHEISESCEKHEMEVPSPIEQKLEGIVDQNPKIFGK